MDLFSGSGGLSAGAEAAGLEVLAGIDFDTNAVATFQRNFPQARVAQKDLSKVDTTFSESLPDCDLLVAGPPCQSFSTSNQRTRTDDNPLNNLLFVPVEVAKVKRPFAVVVENVHGLGIGSRRKYLEELVNRFEQVGYTTTVVVVSGAMVGLPQHRTRLFVVATQKPIAEFSFVEAPQPTVNDAISDLPHLEIGASTDVCTYGSPAVSRYAAELRGALKECSGHLVTNNAGHIIERYKHVPQGGNWRSIPMELMGNYSDVTRCHTGIYHRLSSNLPAKVVGNFRKNMLIHPTQHRGLSIREAARLQSFPDSYVFCGSIGKRQQQVGNAVPPLMAKEVISKIRDGAN
ncbi:DNA cytosine methyltransferase [Ruegeria sp. HKCCD8929]|uniref:DNA cytosine methyltransferase n=1 Tax=Ruegeria sp. HKCCD8929 TaxID=2683006 RepID=UPI001487E960